MPTAHGMLFCLLLLVNLSTLISWRPLRRATRVNPCVQENCLTGIPLWRKVFTSIANGAQTDARSIKHKKLQIQCKQAIYSIRRPLRASSVLEHKGGSNPTSTRWLPHSVSNETEARYVGGCLTIRNTYKTKQFGFQAGYQQETSACATSIQVNWSTPPNLSNTSTMVLTHSMRPMRTCGISRNACTWPRLQKVKLISLSALSVTHRSTHTHTAYIRRPLWASSM